MAKKKKKRRYLSILIISSDQKETISITLKSGMIRFLKIVGVLLLIHIVLGGVFYWQYAKIHHERSELLVERQKLLKENKRVYAISRKFADLSQFAEKLKTSLGVNNPISIDHREENTVLKNDRQYLNDRPVEMSDSSSKSVWNDLSNIRGKLTFIKTRKTIFHDVFRNMPTLLPVDGFLTLDYDTYNKHEFLNRERHIGIDIAAKVGTVVKAAGNGEIIFANWTPELGNLVILYHGNDTFSFYAHNLRILKTEGFVTKGEPIALLGSSGLTSSGPHLHFEIWKAGVPVDPKKFILALQSRNN
ncbi:murein hydrolase activator EnvC precursor [bacterium BMS3Abin05]|nr:murein hydrolase activator EnvC precursor [bacterium BMS3Abin05]GBE26314.1 murein hydrolase activator EnvC precursor [bacterium BMS3Bbin03]HDK36519.1 M23 family metallopeptidase [Bacteroidota bacterium]